MLQKCENFANAYRQDFYKSLKPIRNDGKCPILVNRRVGHSSIFGQRAKKFFCQKLWKDGAKISKAAPVKPPKTYPQSCTLLCIFPVSFFRLGTILSSSHAIFGTG
jgi:hypothetical protein